MPRQIFVLAIVAFLVAIGLGIVGPAIPLLAADFGVGKTLAATAISVFALFRLVSAFANGRLVERFGERRVLGIGLAMQAVTTVLAGIAPNFTLVILFRSLGGFGSAAFTVAAMSLLLRIAPETHRGRAASMYQGGFLLGAIGGPALGGFLTEVSPRVPFIVYGVLLAIAGTVGMIMLRGAPPPPPPAPRTARPSQRRLGLRRRSRRSGPLVSPTPAPDDVTETVVERAVAGADRARPAFSLAQAFRSRAFITCLIINFAAGWTLYGMRTSLMPIYVVEDVGRSIAWAGVAFLIGSAVQALILLRVGKLVDVTGRKPVLIVGAALVTAAIGVLMFPASAPSFLVSMVLMGAGGAMLASAPAAILADLTGGRGGRVVAVFQMASDLGAVIGPMVAGALTDAISYQVAFSASAVVLAIGLGCSIFMPETKRRAKV
ncbi:MFS transporter [Nakamurella sp. YIM 132084]|uniref:MFS transporter n=2 Tax=Nakamurella leprariae TaxID=2803911 RepID=A0A939BZP5_9ACTN|nr:MFS transporter [Nakamurella leprariae]